MIHNKQLADFCSTQAVGLVCISMILLAIVTLIILGDMELNRSIENLGIFALFFQWIGLMSLAFLCLLNPLLQRCTLAMNGLISFAVIQFTTLLVSEICFWLTQWQPMLQALQAEHHAQFLLKNLGISGIIGGIVLRYLYLQRQLQIRTQAQNQARIQALHSRIRPHFLFNSMNTIAALTQIDPDQAEQAVIHLSEVYRATINCKPMEPLSKEIELTRNYLAVEGLRLGTRLQVQWHIAKDIESILIPSLVIQPLVENAVYHSIETREQGGTIEIDVDKDPGLGQVSISIRNPLPGDNPSGPGNEMALDNIRERLQITYHLDTTFSIKQDETHYQVVLNLPQTI